MKDRSLACVRSVVGVSLVAAFAACLPMTELEADRVDGGADVVSRDDGRDVAPYDGWVPMPGVPTEPAIHDGRVVLHFFSTEGVATEADMRFATIRASFDGRFESDHDIAMTPGAQCSVRMLDGCELFRCNYVGRIPESGLHAGAISFRDGPLRGSIEPSLLGLYSQGGANDGPWVRSYQTVIEATGSADIAGWTLTQPTPGYARLTEAPSSVVDRSQPLSVRFVERGRKIGRTGLMVGVAAQHSALCTFDEGAPAVVPVSVLSQLPATSGAYASVVPIAVNDTVVRVGARRVLVRTLVEGNRHLVTLR